MNNVYQRLVDYFGSQTATARRLDVKQGSVSGWVLGKHGMSPVTALKVEALTEGHFRKEDLCPSFPWPPISHEVT